MLYTIPSTSTGTSPHFSIRLIHPLLAGPSSSLPKTSPPCLVSRDLSSTAFLVSWNLSKPHKKRRQNPHSSLVFILSIKFSAVSGTCWFVSKKGGYLLDHFLQLFSSVQRRSAYSMLAASFPSFETMNLAPTQQQPPTAQVAEKVMRRVEIAKVCSPDPTA